MIVRLSIAFVLLITALPATAGAQLNCNSLYSLRSGGGAVCDDAGLDALYDNPVTGAQGNGPLLGLFTPKCANGTDNCPGDEVRCMDGTRPIYYVDPAENPDGTLLKSNGWVFWVTGGGTCLDGLACGQQYAGPERGEMTSASATRFRREQGIFANPANETNLFRHYNRVYLRKCTNDRFAGTNTHLGLPVTPANDTVNLYAHGRYFWNTVFEDLNTAHPTIGKQYTADPCVTPGCDSSCNPGQTCEWLPNLENATNIVLIGFSGGAGGLIHQIDTLIGELQPLAPNADIRVVLDGRFNPSLDVQTSFFVDRNPIDGINDFIQCAGVVSPNCIDANLDGRIDHAESLNAPVGSYSGRFHVRGELPFNPGCGGCSTRYSPLHFLIPGRAWQAHQFLGHQLDQSCEAVHGVAAPECLEPMHVLLNHVSTPHMIRVALEDSSYWGPGTTASGAEDPNYYYRRRDVGDRTRTQAVDYAVDYASRSELALGTDPSWYGGAAGPPPFPQAIFAPPGTRHEGTISSRSFFDTCLMPPGGVAGDELNLHDALFDWVTWDTPWDAVAGPALGWTPVNCPP